MRKTILSLIILIALVVTLTITKADDFIKKTPFNDDTEYLFNRNSIKDFKIFDNDIIALTYSGNILKFDLNTIKQTGELIDSIRFTCLGDTLDGKILLGRKDGAIFILNPNDLSINQIDKMNSEPYYLVTIKDKKEKMRQIICISYTPKGEYYWEDSLNKAKYSGGKTIFTNLISKTEDSIDIHADQLNGLAPTSLIKTETNLIYFGEDAGEFGGYYGLYNPGTRELKSFGTDYECCYGFITTSNKKIFSFGGYNHLGQTSGIVFEINGVDMIEKFKKSFNLWKKTNNLEDSIKNVPNEPINIILENKFKKKLYVFSGNYIYETDTNFNTWKILYQLKLHYKSGRPDAVGSYPAIIKAVILDSNKIICSTVLDGFLLLENNDSAYFSITNQLPVEYYNEYIFLKNKYILKNKNNIAQDCIYDRNGIRFFNPLTYFEYNSFNRCYTKYVTYNDSVFIFTQSNNSNNYTYFNLVEENSIKNLSKSKNVLFYGIFQTTDNQIWSLKDSLFYFDRHNWINKGPINLGNTLEYYCFDNFTKTINQKMPWIVKSDKRKIMILNYDKDMTNLSFAARYLIDKDTLNVFDGCTINNTDVLLTQKGLYSYDVVTNSLKKLKLELPDSTIKLICCDEKGRIWLGGEGLYRIDDIDSTDKTNIHKISSVGNESISTLVADKITKGIIVSIYNRGIYFVK